MAQVEAARPSPVKGHALATLTEKELHELEQYEKIVRFRDTVLSGNHPTIKLPPGLKALAQSLPVKAGPAENGVSRTAAQVLPPAPEKAKAFGAGTVAGAGSSAHAFSAAQSAEKPSTSGRAEINPILLEKSDQLIRAELQLQRQRLERALKDDIEQRRTSKQAEPLVVFDLSDVLTKALTLVEAAATPLPVDEDLTANNEAASDSFNDDTFYSSLHGTPESHLTSRVRNPSEEVQVLGSSISHREPPARPAMTRRDDQASPVRGKPDAVLPQPDRQPLHALPANPTGSRSSRVVVPGLNNYVNAGSSSNHHAPTNSREAIQSGGSSQREAQPQIAPREKGNGSLAVLRPYSPPERRAQDVPPPAPYRTQISSLPLTAEPTPVAPGVGSLAGTSAQIATLRHEPAIVTSSDTSSGERDSDKRKGKRKRRKTDRQAPETEAGQYIKAEPRSPSPLTAPSYSRPNKRQRQSQNQAAEPSLTESGYVRPSVNGSYDPHQPQIYREARAPIVYGEPVSYAQRVVNATVAGREYLGEHHVPGGAYIRRPISPGAPSYQYSPREAHAARAVSQVIVNDPWREPPRAFRDPLDGPRMSVRPEGDSFMVPAKPPPPRIVVDAYGREYIEPPHTAARQSVAPSGRSGEPEIVYERMVPRAVSGHPRVGPYDEGGVVYARPPPPYAVARRYVTQPEYIAHEYRDSRAREYSTQPAGSGEYVRIVSPPDRRPVVDDGPREYISRAANVRPSESIRYEAAAAAAQDYGRMHSVRPDAPTQEYGGSVHAESRRPEALTYVGDYEGGPALQQPYGRGEYVRPAGRYNEPHGRGADEIAFIEGPRRRTQEIVYVDDGRREVYR